MQLNEKVRDTINGFKGVVTARTEYMYGCVRLLVEPDELKADGDIRESQWIDEQRLESLGMMPTRQDGAPWQERGDTVKRSRPGGPQKDAPRS